MKFMKVVAIVAALFALTIEMSAGVLYARRPGTETPVYPLRISHIRTNVTINGQLAVTHVDEEFFNDNNLTLEGFYAFQLPDGARVDGLWLWENGQRKIFVCLKKEDAERKYDSVVIGTRRDPALLEALGQNRFQLKVFPIAPHSSRRIEIQYFQTLALTEDGFVHYRYPLNLAAYQTQPVESTSMTFNVSSCKRILGFKTSFDANPLLNRVTKVDDNTYTVTFGLENQLYGFDYELSFAPEGIFDIFPTLSWKDPKQPAADGYFMTWHGWDDGNGTPTVKRDLVFVLDASGSMAGERIASVTGAAKQVLQKLRPSDHFRLVLFSTNAISYPADRSFLVADPDTIAAALDFITKTYVAEGGTNYEQAFVAGLSADFRADSDRRLLFLTDGEPNIGKTTLADLMTVINAVDPSGVRIYPVLFYTNSIQLLYDIAQARGGKAQNVERGDSLQTVISRLMFDLEIGGVSQASVSYLDGRTYLVHPLTFPPMVSNDQIVTTGRWNGDGRDRAKVRFMKSDATFDEVTRDVDFTSCTTTLKEVGAYWASKRIDKLLADIKQYGETAELKQNVIDLSIAFSVLTPYTAFLVLETNPVDPTLRPDDLLAAAGYTLGASYPQPLALAKDGQVSLVLDAAHPSLVRIVIPDVLGRVLRVLPQQFLAAGRHVISWDGRDDAGRLVAPGTYIVRVTTAAGSLQRRIVVTR
ncbi:MAG: VWA domain-containing protein [Ignavibacteria bacterium]|nr:VWA domain-containing protein [Ignavibacteria bacterium]